MKLQNTDLIQIMKHLQLKYKIGFHKASIALDIYELMLQDCAERFPIEPIEQLLLQLADVVIEYESKDDYFTNYTPEQLQQILTERFDEQYKTDMQRQLYLQKLLGINNSTKNN